MTVASCQLSESLQTLVDTRLDTIDWMLLGRVPRQDRLAIVNEVEARIFELLQSREAHELDRDDVLAVLARLDPPEAYLPEESESGPVVGRFTPPSRSTTPARRSDPRVARASGIIGLVNLALILFSPLGYVIAAVFQSEFLLLAYCFGTILLVLVGSVLGLVLGVYSRLNGVWAVVGVVTSVLSLLFTFAVGSFLLLELL